MQRAPRVCEASSSVPRWPPGTGLRRERGCARSQRGSFHPTEKRKVRLLEISLQPMDAVGGFESIGGLPRCEQPVYGIKRGGNDTEPMSLCRTANRAASRAQHPGAPG